MPGAHLPPLHTVSDCHSQCGKVLTVQIDNGYVGAGDDAGLAHDKPQPSSPASHDSHTTLECEGSQCSLEMKPTAALDRLGRWVFGFVGVFNANGIVGTAERSLVGLLILESSFGGARGALVLLVELGTACNWADGIYRLGEGQRCDARGGCGEELGGACDDARGKHCVAGWMTAPSGAMESSDFGRVSYPLGKRSRRLSYKRMRLARMRR